jgi:hypothetical protein
MMIVVKNVQMTNGHTIIGIASRNKVQEVKSTISITKVGVGLSVVEEPCSRSPGSSRNASVSPEYAEKALL